MQVENHSRTFDDHLNVALCVSDNWATYVELLIYSLSQQHPDKVIRVHLIYSDLSKISLTRLADLENHLRNIRLRLYPIDRRVINKISVEDYYLPLETYYRFLLPDLLGDVHRVVYLDVDILVCGDISPLYEIDLGDSCIAAVHELDNAVWFPEHAMTLGVETHRYFNAGVLVLDLDKMRRRGLSTILINEAAARVRELRFGDQDLLNSYFKDEVVLLDERYNYTNYRMRYENRPIEELAILHYSGPIKPWFTDLDQQDRYYMKYISKYKENHIDYLEMLLQR